MYIKVKDRELFANLDKYLTIPEGFYSFVDKISKNHNLIIKQGKTNYCTNCGFEFINPKTKIYKTVKCPNCKFKYEVRSYQLKNYRFIDSIGLLDRYNNHYVIRYFDLLSEYKDKKFTYDICEYGRKIFDDNFIEKYEICNENVSRSTFGFYINHIRKFDYNWRGFSGYYKNLDFSLIYFPGNVKKILKGTQYQYSQIWKLIKHSEYMRLDVLMACYHPSYEFLIKLKLYNLVGSDHFDYGKTFEQRFGVDKSLLSFMQNININYDQLKVLQIYKKPDKKILKVFEHEYIEYMEEYGIDLEYLLNNTDFSPLLNYQYRDYLEMCVHLEYDLKDKTIKYPKNINTAHDKILKVYKIFKNKELDKKIKERYLDISKNTFKDKKFIIYPVKKLSELINESKQQSNCVKTYAERIVKGECDIYFMRLVDDLNHSLVTVEVMNNRVVQQRIKFNKDTTTEQKKFLEKWEKKILRKEEIVC